MNMVSDPECQLLGALILEPSYIYQVQEAINEDDFASSLHRRVFKSIIEVGEVSDAYTVSENMGNTDENIIYVSNLTDACITPQSVMAYAESVVESSRQRKLRQISQMILESQQSHDKSEIILDKLGEAINLIGTSSIRNTQTMLNEALKQVVAQVQERMDGIGEVYKTGFDELDERMPFEGSKLYLLGGLSGMGKTTLLQAFIEHQIFNDVPCYFNSAEMSAKAVGTRLLQSAGGIKSAFFKDPAKTIGDGEVGARLTAGLSKLKDKNLMIDDEQGLTVEKLKVRARNWITTQVSYQENGKGMLAIDYAQLLDYDHRNSSASLGKITKELRALAKELNIFVILLVQMNNDYKTRQNKRPIPSDIAGSSEMYKDSDGVIFCYRDAVFNENTLDQNIMEIIIGKNRDDEQGTVRVDCQLQYFRIQDIKNKY